MMMMQLENSLFLKKSSYSFKHILPRSFTMFCIRNSLRSTAKTLGLRSHTEVVLLSS